MTCGSCVRPCVRRCFRSTRSTACRACRGWWVSTSKRLPRSKNSSRSSRPRRGRCSMSSSSAGRPRSLPRVRLAPRSVSSDVDDAAFLSSGYGLTPDDWQEDVLDDWLGRRRDGRWAAATCGLAVPRQDGKKGIIEIRELFGMVMLGEKFLHTAHEVKTARKAFLRLAGFFENERQYPELAALVAPSGVRKTNGQEAIVLRNGGSVEFIARSKGSGRG